MVRSTILRLFYGWLAAFVVGLVVTWVGAALLVSQDVLIVRGSDVVGVRGTAQAWVLAGCLSFGGLLLLASGVALLIAWVGVLVNTSRLPGKTWFVLTLVGGVLGLGAVPVAAYLVAGPELPHPTGPVGMSPGDARGRLDGRGVAQSG